MICLRRPTSEWLAAWQLEATREQFDGCWRGRMCAKQMTAASSGSLPSQPFEIVNIFRCARSIVGREFAQHRFMGAARPRACCWSKKVDGFSWRSSNIATLARHLAAHSKMLDSAIASATSAPLATRLGEVRATSMRSRSLEICRQSITHASWRAGELASWRAGAPVNRNSANLAFCLSSLFTISPGPTRLECDISAASGRQDARRVASGRKQRRDSIR